MKKVEKEKETKKNNKKGKTNTKKVDINKEKSKIEQIDNFEFDVFNKIFIALGVIIVFLAFYLFTVFITSRNSDTNKKDNDTEISISTNRTIVGRSLSMPEGEYYVLYYSFGNTDETSIYDVLVSDYTSNSENTKLYVVDMSDALNSSYLSSEANYQPNSSKDIRVTGPTLIKVSNKTVVEYLEGQDSISEKLS